MKKDNNLPILRKNGFMTKIKKAMFVILSAVGLSGSIANVSSANVQNTEIETDSNTKKKEFHESLKVDVNKTNETIIEEILEKRKETGLGEFSQETGYSNKVKEILVGMLDQLDKNFDMNAIKKGNNEANKEEFKNYIISLIENLDDIIYVNYREDMENTYAKYVKSEKNNTNAFYSSKAHQTEFGEIKGNSIVINGVSLEEKEPYLTILHEIIHSVQRKNYNEAVVNMSMVISMLKEGHSTNKSEYIRNTAYGNKEVNVTWHSFNAYDIPTNIYDKLEYLIGEKRMDQFMGKSESIRLRSFLKEELDPKYGEGTAKKMIEYLVKFSFILDNYDGMLNEEKATKLIDKIDERNDRCRSQLKDLSEIQDIKIVNEVLDINNNAKTFLEEINKAYEKDEKISYSKQKLIRKEEKELEKLVMTCINQDIEAISDKNEALNYIQRWDYYRNRCLTNNSQKSERMGKEAVAENDNFKFVYKVQHKLYEKCKEYNVFNFGKSFEEIEHEDVFNMLLEAQLYDVKEAKIRMNKKGTKVIIADQYLKNKFEITKNNDGSIDYISGSEDVKVNKTGIAKGINILSEKEKVQEVEK